MTYSEYNDTYYKINSLDFSAKSELGRAHFPDRWFGHLIEAEEYLLKFKMHDECCIIRFCDVVAEWCIENGVRVECDVLPVSVLPHPDGYDKQISVMVLRFKTVGEMVHFKLRWLDI